MSVCVFVICVVFVVGGSFLLCDVFFCVIVLVDLFECFCLDFLFSLI